MKNNNKKGNKMVDEEVVVVPTGPSVVKGVLVNELTRPKRKGSMISFDNYFAILLKRHPKLLPHHKNPLNKFLSRFGKTNAQTIDWFNTHTKKYGNF